MRRQQAPIGMSNDASSIFRIPRSETSIYNEIPSQESAALSSSNESASKTKEVIKFEIFVDESVGTQIIEIHDKKQISENVERFALKYEIRSKAKI